MDVQIVKKIYWDIDCIDVSCKILLPMIISDEYHNYP